VDQESATGSESDNQILAAASDGLDRLADELAGHDVGIEGPDETRVADLDVLQACPLEHGRDRSTHGLDLG
jgi:hypothetical protein